MFEEFFLSSKVCIYLAKLAVIISYFTTFGCHFEFGAIRNDVLFWIRMILKLGCRLLNRLSKTFCIFKWMKWNFNTINLSWFKFEYGPRFSFWHVGPYLNVAGGPFFKIIFGHIWAVSKIELFFFRMGPKEGFCSGFWVLLRILGFGITGQGLGALTLG